MAIFIALVIVLSLSPIQTSIAKYVVATVNEKFGVDFSLDKVYISPLGYVELEGFQVNDHHENLLAHIGSLKTTFSSIANTTSGQIDLGDTSFKDVSVELGTYESESDTALDILIKSLFQDKKSEEDESVDINISSLELENIKITRNGKNQNQEEFKIENINARIDDIIVRDTLVNSSIKRLSMNTPYGRICDFKADVISDMNKFSFKKMFLQTNSSEIRGSMFYKIEDKKGEQFHVNLKKSQIYLGDLSFLGVDAKEIINIDIIGGGNIDRIDISKLNLTLGKSHVGFRDLVFEYFGQGLKKLKTSGQITESNFYKADVNHFLKSFNQETFKSDFLEYAKVEGEFRLERQNLETNLEIHSNIIKANFKVDIENLYDKKNSKYKGTLHLFDVTLDSKYRKNFNESNLKFTFSGNSFLENNLQAHIHGVASGVRYNKHKYESFIFTVNLKDKELKAFLKTEDEVLDAKINIISKMVEEVNSLKLTLDVRNAEMYELFDVFERKGKLKFKAELNLNTHSIDNFWGVLDLSEIEYRSRDSLFQFSDSQIYGMITDKTKFVKINSEDIISGQLNGNFKLNQVADIATNAFTKIYSNHKLIKVEENQEINVYCNIHNKFFEAFLPGISVSNDTKMQGYLLSEEGEIYMDLESSNIDIYDTNLKNINLTISNKRSNSLRIHADKVSNNSYRFRDVRMFNAFDRDTLFLKTTFDGGELEDDMGELNFYATLNSESRYVFGFKPSMVKYNKNKWYANKQNDNYNKVEITKHYDSIYVKAISLEHEYEKININAFLSNQDTKIDASLSNVNIGNIFPKGLSGYMITGVLSSRLHYYESEKYTNEVLGSLSIEGLNIDGVSIGNLSSYMSSENLEDEVNVYASIKNNYEKSLSLGGHATLRGAKTELDIDVFMDRFNYKFIDPDNEIVSRIRGLATGDLKITGFLENPDIYGDLVIDEGGIKIPYINVDFGFKNESKIHIENSAISAKNIEIFETGYNTKFKGNGTVSYINFQNWMYDINVFSQGDASVFMNTSEKNNDYFYGICYAKGKASLKGQEDDLVLDVEVTLEDDTKVIIPIKEEIMSVDNTFIKIKQRGEEVKTEIKQKGIETTYKGMNINIALNVTPKALLEISMKGASQLRVNSYGSGHLLMKSNLDGDFQIFGNYAIESGSYGLNYLTLIDKEFKIIPGGSIAWEGDVFKGIMSNVKGVYSLEANPDLLTGDTKFNRAIETNVIMNLHGPLLHPETKFDITFPGTASYLKSDLTFYLSDEQQRQIQALSLLARGGFLSQTQTDVKSNLSEGASKLVSSFFKDENSKVDMGLSYEVTAGIGSLISKDRVGFSMSTEISNKVKFNGKVGVPVTGFNTSVVAAEGEIEVPINKEESLTAKIFNRRSEFQDFLSIDQNYTRGVGISYEAEFNSFRELFNKIFSKKKKKIE